ncbi:LLM class flavin-dependent oxidoreductase [Microbacterium sp. A84]|uniref:LLM class flavin-dependent oxidoreductase n=1 Tax=Microbacterium sp. A84 TaxID=3450715 RepID=UPI003F44083C
MTPLQMHPRGLVGGVLENVRAAEDAGLDAVFVPDHLMQNAIGGGSDSPMFEAYTLLGALAMATTRVHLGAFVTPVTIRPPAVLAKMVTTLDVLSGGRAILGLGAGWDEAEHRSFGLDFPTIASRMDALSDTLEICGAMMPGPPVSVSGRVHQIHEARNVPSAIGGRVLVMVGGAGERRLLPLAVEHADIWNLGIRDLDVSRAKVAVVNRLCDEMGRERSTLVRTACIAMPWGRDELRRKLDEFDEIGMDGVVIADAVADPRLVEECGRTLVEHYSGRPDQ